MQRGLSSLLLDSSKLDSSALRQMIQNMGLFGEHQASRNPAQVAPGLKSMMLALRAIVQARDGNYLFLARLGNRGAPDRFLSSADRGTISLLLGDSFADQHPVFIELQHHDGSEGEGTGAQESWTVDLTVGLTETAFHGGKCASKLGRFDAAASCQIRRFIGWPNQERASWNPCSAAMA